MQILAFAVVIFVYFFSGICAFPFTEPDEGRYASISAAMARGDDWITPRLNGLQYYEKPPLFFWCCAASLRIFGYYDWAARIPSALAAFLTCLLILHFGRKFKNLFTGVAGAAIFATMPLAAVVSRVVLVDPLLVLFTTTALYAAWRLLVDERERMPLRFVYLFWTACALAALVKGPIGVLLPLSAVVGYLLIRLDGRAALRLARLDGLILFAAVAAPWYAAMESRNPDYLYEFIIRQNFGRLLKAEDFGRSRPFWYYLPIFAAALAPWTAFLPLVFSAARRAKAAADDRTLLTLQFLACGAVFPLLLLSSSGGKLAYYILPLCPPVALAVAASIDHYKNSNAGAPRRRHDLKYYYYYCAGGILLIGAALAFAVHFVTFAEPLVPDNATEAFRRNARAVHFLRIDAAGAIGWHLLEIGAAWAVAGALAARGKVVSPFAVACGSFIIAFAILPFELRPLAPLYSESDVAEFIQKNARPGEPVVMYTEHVRAVEWKLGRPVLLFHAPFSEFGHKFTNSELEGRSLEHDKEKLKLLLQNSRSALIVDNNSPGVRDTVSKLSPVPVTELATFGAFTIWRTEKR